MTETPIPRKSEDERRKEAEKQRAEAERSLEVVRVKLVHGLIENIERLRKESSIRSLRERILFHSKIVTAVNERLQILGEKELSFPEEMESVREQMRTYESIRNDFKEIMGLSDEKLESLFPKINSYFETRVQAMLILNSMMAQEGQMVAYSLRIM